MKHIWYAVGPETITQKDLLGELEKMGGDKVLTLLVNEKVADQVAKKNNITVTDNEIGFELGKLKKQFATEDMFQQSLSRDGITEDEVKKEIRTHILLIKLATRNVQVTDEELKHYYDEHGKEYGQNEQVKARHILVDSEAEAKAIKARLQKGEDFATLARAKSKDQVSAGKGGELGFFEQGVLSSELEKVAFTLAIGAISDPVKTSFGYHILQVEDRKAAKVPTFDQIRPQMELAVKELKGTPAEQLLPELHKEVNVRIFADRYKGILEKPILPMQ